MSGEVKLGIPIVWPKMGYDQGAHYGCNETLGGGSPNSGYAFSDPIDSSPDIRIGFADLNPTTSHFIGMTTWNYVGANFQPGLSVMLEDPKEDPLVAAPGGDYYFSGWNTTLYQDALHELGHSLGLAHDSSDSSSIMWPIIGPANRDIVPGDNAIAGVQSLYGPPVANPPTSPPPPPASSPYLITDVSTSTTTSANGAAYQGPVSYLTSQLIDLSPDNLNIAANADNVFIHTGSGDDAISFAGHTGRNVADGGTGSNFMTGGNGDDTFFDDARGATRDIWNTIVNFHAGDSTTLWGVTARDFNLNWVASDGTAGYTGLTLHAVSKTGGPTASVTLAGATMADLSGGKLQVTEDVSGGSHYLNLP
jgi:Matrixin